MVSKESTLERVPRIVRARKMLLRKFRTRRSERHVILFLISSKCRKRSKRRETRSNSRRNLSCPPISFQSRFAKRPESKDWKSKAKMMLLQDRVLLKMKITSPKSNLKHQVQVRSRMQRKRR